LRAVIESARQLSSVVEQCFRKTLDQSPNNQSNQGVTESAPSVLPSSLPFSAELQSVVTAWPTLPEHIRAAVLALVGTVKP
jgi:hypothetical protein